MTIATLPLDGVTVVAMEQAVAVPFATRQLADLGARVIKVERPGSGDFARAYDDEVRGISSAFVWLNRGKESIEIDVKSDSGRAVLEALLDRADVFLHNIAPAAARKLRIDSRSLSNRFPNLICGSVSGYGTSGPMADAKAYDLLVQGETGLMSLTGDEDHFAKVGISVADIAAGMYTYASVIAAIHHRMRTGEVLPVDISLFDSLTEWLSYPLYYTQYGGTPPRRMGTNHATIAPYGGFETGDGLRVLLAVQNEREWGQFCTDVLARPDLAIDPRFVTNSARISHRRALDDAIAQSVLLLDLPTLERRMTAARIAFGRMNTIEQLPTHEQLDSPDRWVSTGSEVGPVDTLRPPWFPTGRRAAFGDIPSLGQHTRKILDWLAEDREDPTDLDVAAGQRSSAR